MKQCQVCGNEKESEQFPLPIGWVLEQELADTCLVCLDELAALGVIPSTGSDGRGQS